ncbi:YybH family protein [Nonomuraea cavernae]|uniref:SnoaL-like domain-containing protein n=1 Tax=Nonomuraea cavernae TaxID=2045107 RepID=A0A917YNS1_9ACTN|nr:nuclear transport factor 2 family protein [Nonomuraea cavernae]MCA2183969.1 nuclear transport factor 2 family protein [Nonomuraea cavernae]GGO61931.1 hypothetical protein GCM10012289_05340 [Nonomuraea cavernae]
MTETTPAERQELDRLRQLITTLFENFGNGDIDAMETLLADDCTLWDLFVPDLVVGRQQRLDFHETDRAQSKARGEFAWNINFVREEMWGDVALLCYYFDFTYGEPNAMSASVRITDLLRRRDGEWKIVHHHEGRTPEPPSFPH